MKFNDDAFISYAHLDDLSLIEGQKGWVTNLHRALEVRVGQLLGKKPKIWRDPKLHGDDLFAKTLITRLAEVASLVAVVTPRYLKSEWTIRELDEFWAAAEAQGGVRVEGKSRIFKVLKNPVSLERTPANLRPLLGYEFFRVDPDTGKVREFDEVFGPDAQRDFWITLDDLAHDICALLEESEEVEASPSISFADPPTPEAGSQDAVFLAVTTGDLKDQREALKRELQQYGFAVLPDCDLPRETHEARSVIRKHLARCRLTIQMLGKLYGVVPEGEVQSLMELQHEIISGHAGAVGVERLLWIPNGQSVDDERQQAFLDRVRSDQRTDSSTDLLETFFEDLKTVVRDRMKRPKAKALRVVEPPSAPDAASPPSLYLIADERDVDRIQPWADALFDSGIEIVHPVFDGDEAEIREYHQENLTLCDGVLIFYGSANELWLRRKLRELKKSAGYGRTKPAAVTGVCLIPPQTPTKERFRTHEAMVVPQWAGCVPEQLMPFVDRLKAGSAV